MGKKKRTVLGCHDGVVSGGICGIAAWSRRVIDVIGKRVLAYFSQFHGQLRD